MANTLTDDQKTDAKECFDLFDINEDNTISLTELGNLMRALRQDVDESELREMLKEVDADKSGRLEFNEFLELYARKIKDINQEKELIEAFNIFDRDGNGVISAQELKHVLTVLGKKYSDEEAEMMIREADDDGDGFIQYEEFVKRALRDKEEQNK